MEQPIKINITEKILNFFSSSFNGLFKSVEETRIHYSLFVISSIFVALSIIFGRYLFETFLTFIYAVLFLHIQLARKLEFVDSLEPKQKTYYYNSLFILFIFFTLFWVIFEILRSFNV